MLKSVRYLDNSVLRSVRYLDNSVLKSVRYLDNSMLRSVRYLIDKKNTWYGPKQLILLFRTDRIGHILWV